MRRNTHVARTVALGIVADDIFGALMNASSSHDGIPPAWLIANRQEARPVEIRVHAPAPEEMMSRWLGH